MTIDIQAMIDVLPIMGYGMAGIFLVTGIIIGITSFIKNIGE